MELDFPDESFDVIFHSLLLHWTPDPERAIQEMVRVLKPGGLVFGMQITKPLASSYVNLITQVYQNVYGYFWEEDLRRWYQASGHRACRLPRRRGYLRDTSVCEIMAWRLGSQGEAARMFDTLKVWWVILSQMGSLGSAGRHAVAWIQLYMVEALEKDRFFDYFDAPRSYGQIVAHFGLVDSDYTRDVLETFSSGRRSLLVKEGGFYRRNTRVPLPTREQVARQTPSRFHNITMWEEARPVASRAYASRACRLFSQAGAKKATRRQFRRDADD